MHKPCSFSIHSPPQLHILLPAHQNVETLQKHSCTVTFFKLENCGHGEHCTADSGYGDIHLPNNHQSKRTMLCEYHGWWNTSTLIFLEGRDYMELHYTVNTYSVRTNFLFLVKKTTLFLEHVTVQKEKKFITREANNTSYRQTKISYQNK